VVDEFRQTVVQLLSGPTFEYIPTIDRSAYLKVEVVSGRTFVDFQRDREIVYHRYSYCDTVSGVYETLFSIPYGLEAVSG